MTRLASDHEEKTKIIYGAENAVSQGIRFMLNVKKQMDISFDSRGPSIVVKVDAYRNGYIDIRKRGGKIRAFTEITRDNLHYCKELIEIVDELRHLDGVKGGIAVNETEYMATSILEEARPLAQVIYSSVPEMVTQGHYIFDTFWNAAIPAEYKIKQIEEGIEPELIETIRDPSKVQKMAVDLIDTAENEILVIFSTANAFRRQEKIGMMQLLLDIIKKRGIQLRILTPVDERIEKTAEELKQQSQGKIEIRGIEPTLQTRVSILIVDRKYSLSAELKDDSKATSIEAIGLATYSNSKATVSSYASIFESLWTQAELNEKSKRHDELQKEFINIAAHELRTPIQPILGLTEILYKRTDESAGEYRELLEIIRRNANKLQRLSNSLLDVARIESQSLKPDRETFNLNEVIDEALTDTEKSVVKKVKRTFLCSEKDILVNADRERITQVIANLLTNASNFTKKGTILITLKKEGGDGGAALVSVKDTGAGISQEMMPRLFTKFASKSENGTGLGLFISKGVIEAHGGKIWAENNKDRKGATFAFSLPLTDHTERKPQSLQGGVS